jgi:hypothetical protein
VDNAAVVGTPGIDALGLVTGLAASLGAGSAVFAAAWAAGGAWRRAWTGSAGELDRAVLDPVALTGTPGIAADAADAAALEPDALDVPDAPDALEAVSPAVVPGMAASASSACWSDCDVACLGTEEAAVAAFAVLDDAVLDDAVLEDPALADAVDASGRSPLLTKPCTPFSPSDPEYSCVLTEKLGSESPPMVDSTPLA